MKRIAADRNSKPFGDLENFLADARKALSDSRLFQDLNESAIASALSAHRSTNSNASIIDNLGNLMDIDGNSTFSKLDAKQLAGLAMLQAWALSRLYSKIKPPPLNNINNVQQQQQQQQGGFMQHALGHLIPDHLTGDINSQICFRMQNFGNGAGYNSACFGAAPCDAVPGNQASADIIWGKDASFVLDCSWVGGGDRVLQSSAYDSLLSKHLKCRAAIAATADTTTESIGESNRGGGGVILNYEQQQQASWLLPPRLNVISVRMCSKPAIHAEQLKKGAAGITAFNLNSTSGFALKRVLVNGRKLTDNEEIHSHAGSQGSDGCVVYRYGVPSRALSAGGFVLTGWLELSASHGTGSEQQQFSVGKHASVEINIGEYKLFGGGAVPNGLP